MADQEAVQTRYPEHGKQAQVIEQAQVVGEFLEWLASQGVHLMTWREDLQDLRPTDPECDQRRRGLDEPAACDPDSSLRGKPFEAYWRTHCKHWHDQHREAEGDAKQGLCCRCGGGNAYTVTTRGFIHETRGIEQLLADWAGIDLKAIDAEKRQMLEEIRRANASAATEGPCDLCGDRRPAGLLKRVCIGGEWIWTCTDREETHG
jgi:hypothetical protein